MEGDKSGSNGASPRRLLPEPPPEKGQIRRGGYYDSGSETEDDDAGDGGRYVFQPHRVDDDEGMNTGCKRRRLEDVLSLPSPPTPSSGYDSEGTISDSDHGGAAPVARRVAFPCGVCKKEFGSRKAVDGHMRVHRQGEKKEKTPVVRLAVRKSKNNNNNNARDVVTVAFATNADEVADDNSAGMDIVVLAAVAEPAQAPAPLPVAAPQPMAAVANVVGAHRHAAAAAAQGPPYRCNREGCDKEYATHQALGGHIAGHVSKEKQAAAAACGGDAKPEVVRKHKCGVCGQEFLTGVALGGHMRKHYNDKVIVKKKKKEQQQHDVARPAPAVEAVALRPADPNTEAEELPPAPEPKTDAEALPPAEPKAEVVAEHGAEAAPPPVPAPVPAPMNARRIVRIFGVDLEKPADAEEQGDGRH